MARLHALGLSSVPHRCRGHCGCRRRAGCGPGGGRAAPPGENGHGGAELRAGRWRGVRSPGDFPGGRAAMGAGGWVGGWRGGEGHWAAPGATAARHRLCSPCARSGAHSFGPETAYFLFLIIYFIYLLSVRHYVCTWFGGKLLFIFVFVLLIHGLDL